MLSDRARDALAEVIAAVSAAMCAHCGALPDDDGDHSCPCPYSDAECPDHPDARDR